jgi:hypothetical protein
MPSFPGREMSPFWVDQMWAPSVLSRTLASRVVRVQDDTTAPDADKTPRSLQQLVVTVRIYLLLGQGAKIGTRPAACKTKFFHCEKFAA